MNLNMNVSTRQGEGKEEDPHQQASTADYGYEDADDAAAAAKQKYGYGDDTAESYNKNNDNDNNHSNMRRMPYPRRSSMKQEGQPRRASIHLCRDIEVRLPGKSEFIQRRASIDFSEKPAQEITRTPQNNNNNNNNNDDGDGDDEDCWMQKAEYDLIQKNNSKIVKSVEKGTEKHFCTRGLEGMMQQQQQDQQEECSDAFVTVMDEQQIQRQEGIFDADRISERYRYATLQSKLVAADRAETDNAEIEGYLRSARKIMTRRGSL